MIQAPYPDNSADSRADKKNNIKSKMAWRILISFFFIFLFLTIFIGNEVGSIYSYLASLSASFIGIIYLYIKKNPGPIYASAALIGSIIAQCSTWFVIGASHYVDFLWIVICSVACFLGASRKFAIALLTFNTLGIAYFIYFVQNDHIAYIQSINQVQKTSNFLEILLALFILGYILYEFIGFQEDWEKTSLETNQHLKSQNITIANQNEENVILLKEIHHRVKNNLQIIVSLLRLQKDELASQESKDQFQEAINRILVMSSIHQKLYRQDDFTQINLHQHLRELIDEVKSLFDDHRQIEIDVFCTLEHVDLKTMVPVGLLINELLSNTLKYAFLNRETGKISLRIEPSDKGFKLMYADNGRWNSNSKQEGFGLELIEVFTTQLNGIRSFDTDETGTRYYFDLEFAE